MLRFNLKNVATANSFSALGAIVAALFAGLTYFMAYHRAPKPFEPSVSIGTLVLRDTQILKDVSILTIALGVPLTNSGDSPGCISDIGLTLQSKTVKTQWHFFPAWQINIERYLTGALKKEKASPVSKEEEGFASEEQKNLFLAVEAPFSPVKLPGKYTHQQVILFLPRAPENHEPLNAKGLKPDEYVLSVFLAQGDANCQISSTGKYQQYATTEFVLEKEHLDALSERLTALPLDNVRDKLRGDFLGGNK